MEGIHRQHSGRQRKEEVSNFSSYSAADVQRILEIALSKSSDAVSPHQLQEMADELSIEPSVLVDSVEAWKLEKSREGKKRDRRKFFYRYQLTPFLALNTFLILLDISLAGTITWSIYPLLGTATSLFFKPCHSSHASSSYLAPF
ncbi:MAG: 2TM domain-containing protein [Cyanobacteria bacterium P01_D01_bin.105]